MYCDATEARIAKELSSSHFVIEHHLAVSDRITRRYQAHAPVIIHHQVTALNRLD